jgi:hypothetical protein
MPGYSQSGSNSEPVVLQNADIKSLVPPTEEKVELNPLESK